MGEAIATILRVFRFDLQGYLKPFLYGLLGGLAAVAFQLGIKLIEWVMWTQLSTMVSATLFVAISIATILATSLVAGLLLTFFSPDAAAGFHN